MTGRLGWRGQRGLWLADFQRTQNGVVAPGAEHFENKFGGMTLSEGQRHSRGGKFFRCFSQPGKRPLPTGRELAQGDFRRPFARH